MPSYVFAEKGVAFVHYISLVSQADTDIAQVNPTLATGDVQVSVDGAAFANLATLPVVTPAGGKSVKVSWSAAEMNGDHIITQFTDAAGDEWQDVTIIISTAPFNALDLAQTGADGDTLETLSDQLDGVTVSVQAATATISSGTTINVYRGTTWVITVTGLGNISAYDTIFFTVKGSPDDTDADAILKVYNNASGLLIWNKATATAAQGKIVVDDATAGDITITIQEEATVSALLRTGLVYDIKGIDDNSSVVMLSAGGQFNILGDITRAIVSP